MPASGRKRIPSGLTISPDRFDSHKIPDKLFAWLHAAAIGIGHIRATRKFSEKN